MYQSHFDRFWIIVDSGVNLRQVPYCTWRVEESRVLQEQISKLTFYHGNQEAWLLFLVMDLEYQQTRPAGAQFHFESAQVSQEVFIRNLEL